MPFTFSHPAIVLPLALLSRKWFSLTGLIIGSLTPDFEYFIRMKIQSDVSHTLSGLFWFNLPLGIILTFIFHDLVRNYLISNLSIQLKSRFSKFQVFNWRHYFKEKYIVVIISILIGATSHLFWDSFTHEHGYFVNIIPVLKNNIFINNFEIPLFKLLQHTSTIFGGFIIFYSIYKLPKSHQNINIKVDLKYWTIFSIVMVTIISIRFLLYFNFNGIGQWVATGISAGIVSLILTSFYYKFIKSARALF